MRGKIQHHLHYHTDTTAPSSVAKKFTRRSIQGPCSGRPLQREALAAGGPCSGQPLQREARAAASRLKVASRLKAAAAEPACEKTGVGRERSVVARFRVFPPQALPWSGHVGIISALRATLACALSQAPLLDSQFVGVRITTGPSEHRQSASILRWDMASFTTPRTQQRAAQQREAASRGVARGGAFLPKTPEEESYFPTPDPYTQRSGFGARAGGIGVHVWTGSTTQRQDPGPAATLRSPGSRHRAPSARAPPCTEPSTWGAHSTPAWLAW